MGSSLRRLALYSASVAFFYTLSMAVPSLWFEALTAWVSHTAMGLMGLGSSWGVDGGWVWLALEGGARPVRVYIIRECTGIHVCGLLAGLILPLEGVEAERRLKGLALGWAMVFALNILRVVATVALTGFDVPPFSWLVASPNVETYHYPVSFAFGVVGVALVVWAVSGLVLPELGDLLVEAPGLAAASAQEAWSLLRGARRIES